MTTTVHLTRVRQAADLIRKYKIFIDDEFVDNISSGETLKFEVNSGEHLIQLKIDWCSSNTLSFNARAHETFHLECGNRHGKMPKNYLEKISAITLERSSFLYVKIT